MKSNWKATIAAMMFLSYTTLLAVYWNWLLFELERGSFPAQADSIAIPMMGFLLIWFIGFLVFPVLLLASKMLIDLSREHRKFGNKTTSPASN